VHVDGAQAVAGDLRGERLRRDDPRVPRGRDELVLDAPVARQDAELADRAAVEAAAGAAQLENTAREVRLEARCEAQ